MTIHGIGPGPQVMQKQPDLVWGMIASMWIGNDADHHQPAAGRHLGAAVGAAGYRLMFPDRVSFVRSASTRLVNAFVDVVLAVCARAPDPRGDRSVFLTLVRCRRR